jgi:acetyl-CoA carboxylase carboxyltransferase component
MGMKDLADELEARREKALAMGGADAIAKQHGEGKLTVRERVDRLFDPRSFQEIGLLANHANISPAMKGRDTPADGVVTGFGKINGRPAALIAYDFTVMAGSFFSRTCRGSWSGRRSKSKASFATAPRCSTRSVRPRCRK